MIEIVDASVAAKWFLSVDESGVESADGVLRGVIEAPHRFAAPSLLSYELLAVLCRRLPASEEAQACFESYLALGIRLVELDGGLIRDAIALAFEYRLTGYDAAYVATARHLGGTWLTFDRQVYRRVAGLRVARLLT